ncbi:hypothetical protein [Halosimplex sp. TS25]|uniref:hypothetical protein n=1 Tax=Halosimplex rarum TaxID=3396619 RepID=UPI0039ED9AF8
MSSLQKTWDTDVVTDYIKQESQQKSPDVFLETHIPIRKIRAESLIGYDGDFVSETGLFKHVVQSNPQDVENRIYLLKGEVGSGKSHLCQWLEYQLNGYGDLEGAEEHVAIHISRNNTRMADILAKLYEHIDAEHEELDDIIALDPVDLADFIITGLRTFGANTETFSGFELDDFIEDYPNKLDLRSALEENIREYQHAVEKEDREQRIELITREEFGRICFNVFGETFKDSEVFPTVRNAIHDRLIKNVGIEDFQNELADISDKYQKEGKRPVLICEDVTTFTFLKDDLMDHIFQLGDGGDEMESGYDVILGYTTGWETEKADDALTTGDLSHMRQRADGYLRMTNENGEAYFLEDGAMPIQLVRKYLSVIKQHSDSVDLEGIDQSDFDDLYPFNEQFIMRAYANLVEDGNLQQTPRLLLYHVIGDCLRSEIPPHEKMAGNTYIREFTAPTSAESYSASFRSLVKWYGRMEGGRVVVPETYFEAFDIAIPDDITVVDGHVHLDVLYENVGWEVPDSDLKPVDPDEDLDGGIRSRDPVTERDTDDSEQEDGNRPSTPKSKTTPVEEKEAKKEQSERAKRIEHFRNWFGGGGEFPSANRLREGVQAALNRFYDPTRLANENATTVGTAGFYYASGSDVPVEIRGPDAGKDVAVTVSHVSDEYVDYERMLYEMMHYGLEGEFREDANLDAIRSWVDDNVVAFRQRMRTDLEDALADEMTLEEFLILARFLVFNAAHGDDTIDRGKSIRDSDEYSMDDQSPFKWEDSPFELPAGLTEGLNGMTTRRADIAGLCQGFFLLKSNFVDHDRLAPAIRNVSENLDGYIDAATRIDSSEVADAYRIGTTRSDASGSARVARLFEIVSDYASEIEKLQQSFDISAVEEDIETVSNLHSSGHTAADLKSAYECLRDCIKPLDINLRTRWEDTYELLEQRPRELALAEFGQTLETFETIDPRSGVEVLSLMYEYNDSRSSQEAWTVYTVLAEMIEAIEDHPDAEAEAFRELVRDSEEFGTFVQKRDTAVETIRGI